MGPHWLISHSSIFLQKILFLSDTCTTKRNRKAIETTKVPRKDEKIDIAQ